MNITTVLQEFRKRGRSVVLEKSSNFDYGDYVVLESNRFRKEETARQFYENEVKRRIKKDG